MTKEQMIAKVEMAHEIYEKLKVLPVPEREAVFTMIHQFNQKDWNDYHNSQKVAFASDREVGLAKGNCENEGGV